MVNSQDDKPAEHFDKFDTALYEPLTLCVKGIYVIYLRCIIFVLNKLIARCTIASKLTGLMNHR